jgi:hypothetical protein
VGSSISVFLCIAGAMLFVPGASWAAHPLITDDAGTQGSGKFQIETSGVWLSDKSDVNGVETKEVDSFAAIVFTGGLAETVDLALTVPYVWTEATSAGTTAKENGFSDTVVEAKWRFFEKENLSLALKPGVLIPTGDDEEGLGTGHFGYTAFLIATYEAEPWAIDVNLGYLHLQNRAEERVIRWFTSMAARYKFAEQWKLVGEAGAARNPDAAGSSYPVFAQAGAIYSPKDNLDLSAGYVIGLSDAEIDHTARVGVTFRF